MSRFTRATSAIVATAALLGALAACGGGDAPAASSSTDSQSHNAADVAFATDMIPHHGQAIDMASMAATQADSPEVSQLAQQIMDAQDPEIQTMSGWLKAWGEPVPDSTMGSMGSMDMPGLMSQKEMSQLANASGMKFDMLFLDMMIVHHQSAIDMANKELADGQNADALKLAQDIIDNQQAQIDQMQTMQKQMGS